MASDSTPSSSVASVRHNEYILPKRSQLFIQGLIKPLNSGKSFSQLWQTQAMLVMAHIFEVLDFMEVHVDDEATIEFEGKQVPKPCLILERQNPSGLPSYEIETSLSRIICEHFYKYYIFTHQVESPAARVARPVVSENPLVSASSNPSDWIIQPKNSNKLVRTLRGKRKAALQIVPMVEHMMTTTNSQLAKLAFDAGNEEKGKAVWLPSDFVILARKLRLTTYHGGKALSILDFVSMVHVKAYLELLEANQELEKYFGGLANILEWVDRIQRISEWKNAVDPYAGAFNRPHQNGGHGLKIMDFAMKSASFDLSQVMKMIESKRYMLGGSASVMAPVGGMEMIPNLNSSPSVLDGEIDEDVGDEKVLTSGDVTSSLYALKIQQEKVRRGKGEDWVTNKQRNHHLVKTPYEDLLSKLSVANIEVKEDELMESEALKLEFDFLVPWSVLPVQLDPAFGMLNEERALRKRQQISNIVRYASRMMRDGARIVDFCGGGGHVSLVLAWIFPKVKILLLDRNEVSLAIAEKRRKELGLENMKIVCSDVQAWNSQENKESNEKFDIGVAIHACGSLSDIIMEKCIENGASYIMAPCCFGALQNADTSLIPLPRSSSFSDAGITIHDYLSLSATADINTSGFSLSSQKYKTGKHAMRIIDLDRNLRASQEGYSTFQFTMFPPTCSPKNDIICGLAPSQHPTQASRSFFDLPISPDILSIKSP